MEPACVRDRPGSVYLICSFWSVWTTDTPRVSGTLSVPLAPLIVTDSGDTVAVTPFGRSTGALAILDMIVRLSYATMHRTSPPCPIERACLSVITPFGVDTITVPM